MILYICIYFTLSIYELFYRPYDSRHGSKSFAVLQRAIRWEQKKNTWNTFIYVICIPTYFCICVVCSFFFFFFFPLKELPVYQKCTLQLIIIINGNKYTDLFSSEWNHSYCSGHRPIGAAPGSYSEHFLSIGILSSYSVGACSMIPAVPAKTANVNIHKKSRSNTIATYFQSSLVWMCE